MSTPAAPTAAANDYLAKQNPHPRDAHIHFDEGPHKYTIDGINGVTADTEFTSVTTFIHQHFEHFDAKKVIAGMMRNQKKWNDPVANAKYYGKTAEEIEQMWADAGKDASTKGTAMHHQIECFYNTPPAPADVAPATNAETAETAADVPPEIQYFLNFNQEHVAADDATLRPYRTEWTVFHEEAQIAGSIDMVYEVIKPPVSNACELSPDNQSPHQSSEAAAVGGQAPPTGLSNVVATLRSHRSAFAEQDPPLGGGTPLAIYDWKRCREITKTNRAGKFATHPAIEHLPDTNFWHYALQLNTYKYILQTKYDKTITDLYLIVLHPDAQNYQRVKLPDLQTEVAELFEERIRNNKSK
jgi:hypothetical protein